MPIDFAHQIVKHIIQTDMEIQDAINELEFSDEIDCDSFLEEEIGQEIIRCDQCKVWHSHNYCYKDGDINICDSCLNSGIN
jgi:hypothetical protein